jgi:hypothetical protein
MFRTILSFKILLSCLLFPATASAAPGAIGVAGDVGMGGLGGKAYATLQTGVDLREGRFGLGLFGRVRFPLQDVPTEGHVRGRDWDEASDYVHILRYMQYKHTFARRVELLVQEGELLGFTLGHGTLLRDYSNVADPDHPHAGLQLRLAHPRLAFTAMIDNFIRPSVIAARLEGAPAARVTPLRIGASFVIDPRAPVEVRSTAGEREIDSAFNLQAETRPLPLVGIDVEYTFGNEQSGSVTPYLDTNTSFYGFGLHVGATGRVPLQTRRRMHLGAQLEYRLSTAGYSPAYMETFYDVDRFQASLSLADPRFADAADRSTKLAGLRDGIYGGHGILFQGGYELERYVRLKLGVSHRPGPDATSLWARVATSPIARLDLGLLLVARGIGEGDGASGLVVMAEGRVRIIDHLYALAQYSRLWSLSSETRYFGILQLFNIGVGTNWSS